MSLPAEGEFSCIVDCSLEYPACLHDSHPDYPLAPEKKLTLQQLSPFAREIMRKLGLSHSSACSEKLLATVENKEHYVTYFKNLQN